MPAGQGLGAFTLSIIAARSQIAILSFSGNVFLYNLIDFIEFIASLIMLGKYIDRMQLNSAATLLTIYSYRKTKVWEVSTGK
jgi:hypothetical protein